MEHDMTTAGELAAWAGKFPPEQVVLVQSDADGNDVNYLAAGAECMLDTDDPDGIGVYNTPEDLEELKKNDSGWSDDDAAPDGSFRALLLIPR